MATGSQLQSLKPWVELHKPPMAGMRKTAGRWSTPGNMLYNGGNRPPRTPLSAFDGDRITSRAGQGGESQGKRDERKQPQGNAKLK